MKNHLIKKVKYRKMEQDPAGNVIEELTEQDMNNLAGATAVGMSKYVGNRGSFCTVTKECQPNCY